MDGHSNDIQKIYEAAAAKLKEAELLDSLKEAALKDAIQGLDTILAAHPTNAEASHLLGLVELRRHRFEQALKAFKNAVMFRNDRLDYHWQLSQLLLMLGRRAEAIETLERTVLCLPMEALAHKWLSDLYKQEKRMEEASAAYGRWIELNPEARPITAKETAKAKKRREQAGFFERYCQGQGIDIGWGGDLVAPNCRPWDFEDGDAELMEGVPDGTYDFVYSSHNLEHMHDVDRSVTNWWRILKPGGYMILFLPHRDLFEKRTRLPSAVHDHRHYFLPERDDPPDTIGVLPLLARLLPDGEVVSIETCSEGNSVESQVTNNDGEYSIEVIVRKAMPA